MIPDNPNPDIPKPELSPRPQKPQTAAEYISGISKNRPMPESVKNLTDVVSHPDYLTPKEKISTAIMMTRELTTAGKDTPDSIEELSGRYMEWLVEKKTQNAST